MWAVSASQTERLTRAFYEWELRGRGWESFPYRTRLEPQFQPFSLREGGSGIVDDGRRHTWLSSLVDRLLQTAAVPHEGGRESDETPAPPALRCDEEPVLREFLVALPPEARASRAAVLGWLGSFGSVPGHSALELVGCGGRVEVRLAVEPGGAAHVLGQLRAALPGSLAVLAPESLRARWSAAPGTNLVACEFGLASEFMVPLGLRPGNDEPLLALVAALAETREGELGLVQVLFEPCRERWTESVLQSVVTPSGEPFFADAPEITALAREKVATPLFAVALRAAALALLPERAIDVLQHLAGALAAFGSPLRNEFLPLSPSEDGTLEDDLLARTTHRAGMLLSAAELAALVHLPGAGVQVPGLWRGEGKTRAAPAEVLESGCLLGENQHAGVRESVRLQVEARVKHVHVIGASGTGKSTLLVRMILEDVEAGNGVGVLDPHGDLVDEVAARIPSERLGDCVFLDPSDEETAGGWNVLGADSEAERDLLASDLVGVFRRLSTSWGDQMTAVLANAITVFLRSPRGGTLLELRRFLVDAEFRKEMLRTVADPYAASFWETEFPRLIGRRPETPILTRLDMFLRSPLVRRVVTATDRRLDFRKLTDEGGIFLGKLAAGTIGEENAALLGSLLVSKFHQTTLARAGQAAESRRPFFLYVDEFHAVATASMASLFSGARKYRLGLTVAHQDLSQLHASMPELERSILANAYTRICFRLGEDDARQMAKGLSYFDAEDLMSLGLGEAICRVGGRGGDFNLKTERLEPLSSEAAERRQAEVRESSRAHTYQAALSPPHESEPRVQVAEVPAAVAAQPASLREAPSVVQPPRAAQSTKVRTRAEDVIDKAMLDYLTHVAGAPFLTVRERNAALGLSAWRGHRLKSAILREGLATEVAMNPGGRGERFKLLDLSEKGRTLLDRYGVATGAGRGRGGIAHQWWAHTIATWLRARGLAAEIEGASRGARVDVSFATQTGEPIAVEIELSEGHAIENIRKDLAAGFTHVLCLLDSPGAEERIRSKLGILPGEVVIGDLHDHEALLTSLLSSLRGPNQNEELSGRRRRLGAPRPPAVSTPRTPPSFEPGAFSTPLAADYLGLSPATLETLRTRGGGPPFSKLGRRVVYAREDLDAWLIHRKRSSTSQS